MDLTALSLDELSTLAAEKKTALSALFDLDSPDDDQVSEIVALDELLDGIDAELAARQTKASESASKLAAAKEKFAAREAAAAKKPEEPEVEPEVSAAVEPAADAIPEVEPEPVVAGGNARAKAAAANKRPQVPAVEDKGPQVLIAAAAETGFASGSALSMQQVGEALVHRVRGMKRPTKATQGSDIPMQFYPAAKFEIEYPDELTVGAQSDGMEVASYAGTESRLPGGSLVAAGGWCAPSENIYDLCDGETLEGLISVPEINVSRGGINFTKGPQFSDFYGTPWTNGHGFLQTETEAIAGETKDCFELSCPDFTDVRLDAVGLCLKFPILTEAGYPELVKRYSTGALTAHQHRVSVEIINRMVALSGAAKNYAVNGGAALGSAASDALAGLTIIANKRREEFRLAINASLEVVLPFWVKDVYKDDLGRRSGRNADAVSDAELKAHFDARHLAVQWVYGWQPLNTVATGTGALQYPTTYNALMYPAGTFVVGKANVIDLSAVYDAASLEVNTYTGTFTEQGLLVAEMCFDSDVVTLPTCAGGRTGANDLDCTV